MRVERYQLIAGDYRIEAVIRLRARAVSEWLRLHLGQVRRAGPMMPKRITAPSP